MDRPNIVIVNCDDLGDGDLGCYWSHQHDAPHLDRMAADDAGETTDVSGDRPDVVAEYDLPHRG